ncbi:MAG: cysteine synthase, partial [Halolamina sp.]
YGRERHADTHVVAVEPEGSLYGTLLGEEREEGEYKVEGIGTHDTATNELFEPELVDAVHAIPDSESHAEVQRLAAEEGHLVASSAGANAVAAKTVARAIANGEIDAPHDAVVTVFPDSSERYLSKGIYGEYEEWEG